jgi:hypothetical protein
MTPKNDIQDELNQISDHLKYLKPVNPYRITDGYFEELPKRIMERLRTEDSDARGEIGQLSPVLAKLKGKETYQVEEDYFEKQSSSLANVRGRIRNIYPKTQRIQLWTRMAVAASFIGILGLGIFFYTKHQDHSDTLVRGLNIKTDAQFNQQLNELDSEDIIYYLNQFASVYDQGEMEKMIDPHFLPDESDYLHDPELNELLMEPVGVQKNM